MKNNNLLLIITLLTFMISCSTEERVIQKDIDHKLLQFPNQRIKKLIESDMTNDIVCDITFPICRTLMVMTAIESCR